MKRWDLLRIPWIIISMQPLRVIQRRAMNGQIRVRMGSAGILEHRLHIVVNTMQIEHSMR